MHYSINVTKKEGKLDTHFFATADHSLSTMEETQTAFDIFKKKFPEREGYKITVARYETVGEGVTAVFEKE